MELITSGADETPIRIIRFGIESPWARETRPCLACAPPRGQSLPTLFFLFILLYQKLLRKNFTTKNLYENNGIIFYCYTSSFSSFNCLHSKFNKNKVTKLNLDFPASGFQCSRAKWVRCKVFTAIINRQAEVCEKCILSSHYFSPAL